MSESTSSGTSSSGADFDLTQFYQVFFEEAGENLANMETLLLELDVDNPDNEQLNAIFRCAHSIKGGSATFGFQDVADLTHVMETLLDRLRRHELSLNPSMVDVLLESGDTLKGLLARHQGSSDELIDASDLVSRIRVFAQGPQEQSPAASQAASAYSAPPAAQAPQAAPEPEPPQAIPPVPEGSRRLEVVVGPLKRAEVANDLVELFGEIPGLGTIRALDDGTLDANSCRKFEVITASSDDDLLDLFTFHVARDEVRITAMLQPEAAPAPAAPAAEPAQAAAAPTDSAQADPGYGFFVDLDQQRLMHAQQRAASKQPGGDKPQVSGQTAASRTGASDAGGARPATGARGDKPSASIESSTLRVSVERVDQLINLVGELVITQAMLAQTSTDLDPRVHQRMLGAMTDLERNTRLLQESVMAIRMIPMAVVFNRFPRMLRDLAGKLGKQVELHTVGETTELDKGMVEKITDPLTHLVRNSLDHGVEPPEERIAKGKSPTGSITLSAAHRGGSIAIEVRDDGRGLSREKIYRKAEERGLAVHPQMSDQEVFQLIFEPGFSTAEVVTDVSGRGVGMDVVRKNILSLGGSVELDSAEGFGTQVTVRLPLTLAIMDGMSVAVGEETYIIPLGSVVESIKLDDKQLRSIGGVNRVVEVRQEFLSVLPLEEMFDVPRRSGHHSDPIMVVVEAEGARIALLVDELIGQQQVVVKNLEANYRKVQGISGATILGDGQVALILDVAQLVRRTRH